MPAPVPAPELEPVVAPPPQEPATVSRRWNINELEALVNANAGSDPGQVDELQTYLFFLRDHASIDGDLPPQFDSLISDVFGELIEAR